MWFCLKVIELGWGVGQNTYFPPRSVSIHANKEIYVFDTGSAS